VIAGVLLAGGASSRMGRDKALVRDRGASFLVHGVRHLWAACDSVIVVLGARAPAIRRGAEDEFQRLVAEGHLDRDLRSARRKGARGLEAHFVRNARWNEGMFSSIRVGLLAALELEPKALMLLPVDHPRVAPATVAGLANMVMSAVSACRPRDRAAFRYAMIPRHRRRRGHPVALTAALARDIVADREATDLSDAIRRHARLVGYADVADAGVLLNRNTPLRVRRSSSAAPPSKSR
jgi:CTP:molybdopterin cytidylyltransferase MocA